LGGDFNDPEGKILELLKNSGISFKIKSKEYKINFQIEYDRAHLFSCCANRDSQTNKKSPDKADKDQIELTVGTLENAFNRVLGKNKIGNKNTQLDPIPYDPINFYDSSTFGYNGDYALFGENVSSSKQFKLELDNSDTAYYKYDTQNLVKKVMASDHLPVVAKVPITGTPVSDVKIEEAEPTKGGRRRSSRVLKRNTKKGLPKKRRVSLNPLRT
jgi:hypothetical protein